MRIKRLALVAVLFATAATAEPVCQTDRFEGTPFTACTIDPGQDDVRLFYRTADDALIGSFSQLAASLETQGDRLSLAMNGGMYHPDRRPVGLYVENGVEIAPLVLAEGPGNFALLPNGVLCLSDGAASISESRAFAEAGQTCTYATQSGPLMVQNGQLHPRFLPDGSSRYIRNGVGVREDGTLVAAISDAPVNFHRFARLFRDRLGAPDALYVDGRVSRLYAPALGRADIGLPLGPILGVVEPTD